MEIISAHLAGDTTLEEVLPVALDRREWAALVAQFPKGAAHVAA